VLEPISSESGSVEEMEAEEKVRNPKKMRGYVLDEQEPYISEPIFDILHVQDRSTFIEFGLGPYLGHETSAKSSSLLIRLAKTLIKVFPQT
jgi:hypothetical protein